ncbi:transcriptional regulator [Campylobacter californiensis]|uniref:transcriptional regulator n=1 Tax=Campylobacter californiensis TaxID=1032243 RepID=UPI00188435DC|nr:transcriptional regulator [Campylobacter sp. RM12916]
MENENLIKQTCKELNLTYKQLGEAIGYSEGALKTISSTGKVSENLEKSIALLYRIKELESKNQEMENLKTTLKNLLDLK